MDLRAPSAAEAQLYYAPCSCTHLAKVKFYDYQIPAGKRPGGFSPVFGGHERDAMT